MTSNAKATETSGTNTDWSCFAGLGRRGSIVMIFGLALNGEQVSLTRG